MSEVEIDETSEEDKNKGSVRELLSTVFWALTIALVLRTFIFQPFHIPSGSMLPGLKQGDYIITSKYSVGYGKYAATPLPFPKKKGRLFERDLKRGDVLVFRPLGTNKNYIKRLIGLPGDQIQMVDGFLHVNGVRVSVESLGTETFNRSGYEATAEVFLETFENGNSHKIYDLQKNGPRDNTDLQTVPAGHYFMMGDNRDDSLDSRASFKDGGTEFVPTDNIIGKAEIVLLSVEEDFVIYKPWTWLNFRGDRWFKKIK